MSKKSIIILSFAGIAAAGLVLLGRYQRESFKKTLSQIHEDFLKGEDETKPKDDE